MLYAKLDYIAHHGVKGMKWGVRRYQNKDGSLTDEGRKQRMYRDRTIRAGKTQSDVQDIVNSLSKDELRRLGMSEGEKDYLSYEQGSQVVKRVLKYDGDTPVAFFDLLDDGDTLNSVIATRSDYRGKGYAYSVAKTGMDWYDKNKDRFAYKEVVWGVRTDNKGSRHIADKLGFIEDPNSLHTFPDGEEWINYTRK